MSSRSDRWLSCCSSVIHPKTSKFPFRTLQPCCVKWWVLSLGSFGDSHDAVDPIPRTFSTLCDKNERLCVDNGPRRNRASAFFLLFFFHLLIFSAELFLFQIFLLLKEDKKSLAIHKDYLSQRTALKKQNVWTANQQRTPKELDVGIIFARTVFQSKDASCVACWPALMTLIHL